MCCFSQEDALTHVGSTKIFARFIAPNRQVLAYSMAIATSEALAMILPLPVPPGSAEDAVRFINLEGYPELFDDLRRGYPIPRSRSLPPAAGIAALKVHDVGAFEASFVPNMADFSRLDPRFSIAPAVWAKLPAYADYGFAVFKLKTVTPRSQTIHPMALSFPTRRPDALFFPTVHIHDGRVHSYASFDHTLFCQRSGEEQAYQGWVRSSIRAAQFVKVDRAAGLIDGKRFCFRHRIRGSHPNRDTWLSLT